MDVESSDKVNTGLKTERLFDFIGDILQIASCGIFSFHTAKLLVKDPSEPSQEALLMALNTLYASMVIRKSIFWLYYGVIAR